MTAAILSSHRKIALFGLAYGQTGAIGCNRVLRKNGRIEALGSSGVAKLEVGDRFLIETLGAVVLVAWRTRR